MAMNAPADRFSLWRLCPCSACEGTGKAPVKWAQSGASFPGMKARCPECRGEGRVRQELATAATPEAIGVALVTLARESEFSECPIGLLDSEAGEESAVGKWLIRPWLPSARNVSDAGRVLGSARKGK